MIARHEARVVDGAAIAGRAHGVQCAGGCSIVRHSAGGQVVRFVTVAVMNRIEIGAIARNAVLVVVPRIWNGDVSVPCEGQPVGGDVVEPRRGRVGDTDLAVGRVKYRVGQTASDKHRFC